MTAIVKHEPLTLERAIVLIEQAKSLDEAKDIRDRLKALDVYARERDAGVKGRADLAECIERAEFRMADFYADTPKATGTRGQGRPAKSNGKLGSAGTALPKAELPPLREILHVETDDKAKKLAQKLKRKAKMKPPERAEAIAKARAKAAGVPAANFTSESVEWYTPAKYIDAARNVLGGFDLDPASSDKANEIVKAKRFFTAADDGLGCTWNGRVWLNPPYGSTKDGDTGAWAAKLVDSYRTGRVKAAILLVNATTDRKWFQQLWDFPICFTDHRIEFYTPAGQPKQPVSGNAFVYFGAEVEKFARVFAEHGAVVQRVQT